ncbi:hypothetical protein HU147_02070 [Planomicrobium chinense]|uniref:hypothetical protein n=1 Tax=Planococcus chinensis TaxID=272917 RepID=UPI001CC3E897|nr:hypothetical protein [Planococcus chinensis]MBZ5199991.1 hypothetical protein [Planococcus chinensis]MCP2034037.1 hypothetical protein [Planomicrobium sp. HSC-17F08]
MFRTDEFVVRQRMKDIRTEIERDRMRSQFKKTGKQKGTPFWIVLLTFLHLHKSK